VYFLSMCLRWENWGGQERHGATGYSFNNSEANMYFFSHRSGSNNLHWINMNLTESFGYSLSVTNTVHTICLGYQDKMLGNSPTVGSTIGGSGLTITALISMRAWEMFVSCVPWIYPDPPKLIKLRSRPAADVFATRSTPTSVPNTLDIQLPKIYPPQKGMVSDRISTSIRILISAIIASVYIITCIYIHIIIYIYIYIRMSF
jgi:hypothetical protein